jgi:hypothetical protein
VVIAEDSVLLLAGLTNRVLAVLRYLGTGPAAPVT